MSWKLLSLISFLRTGFPSTNFLFFLFLPCGCCLLLLLFLFGALLFLLLSVVFKLGACTSVESVATVFCPFFFFFLFFLEVGVVLSPSATGSATFVGLS